MKDFVKGSKENISVFPSEKKYLMVMDENTGKIKGCFPLKKKSLGNRWVAVYQQVIAQVAKEKLTGEQCSVFLYLLSIVDFDNYLTVNQKDLAEVLNIKQPHIARAIKKLRDLNIIVEGPRAGLNKTYRLNPYIAHKGKERKKTIVDFEEIIATKGSNVTELVPTENS